MSSLVDSVRTAGEAGGIDPRDQATVDLALAYAAAIDGTATCGECAERVSGDLTKLGPALLAALEALRLSPRARAAATKAVTSDKPAANPLDQLADARARRGRPQAVDTATS